MSQADQPHPREPRGRESTQGRREEVLTRVRRALSGRERTAHPGPLSLGVHGGADAFRIRMEAAGAQVRTAPAGEEPQVWIRRVVHDLIPDQEPTVAVGHDVPPHLVPDLPPAPPEDAAAGISIAWAGAVDSGSVILPSEGGRRVQLLTPLHIVWLDTRLIYPTLQEALGSVRRRGMGATVGLHSGPSKSADIGRTLVTGVHGPGTLVVALF